MKDGESVFLEYLLSEFTVVRRIHFVKSTYYFLIRNYRNVPEIISFFFKLTLVKLKVWLFLYKTSNHT